MSGPLTLVRSSTATPMHPDTRASAALQAAIDAASADGYGRGEWAGHLRGWRSGVVCGLCWGFVLTGIAAAAARAWGWL